MRLRALLAAAVAAVFAFASVSSHARPPALVAVESSRPSCAPGSVPRDSVAGHLYKYCGQHWPKSKLPIRIHINTAGAKPDAGTFMDAVRTAVSAWDSVAPPVHTTGPRPGGCANARIICVASVSGGSGQPGEVDVGWGETGGLGLPASAFITPSSGPISSARVVLNWNLVWFGSRLPADADEISVGLAAGSAAGVGCGPLPSLCPDTHDLVGLVMHELGHVIGLEDLNPGMSCTDDPKCGWPQDLTDAPDYTQVMYAFYYRGSSSKRALGAGDLAGLYRVLEDATT